MTVSITDKKTREKAIPYQSTPWSNSSAGTNGTTDAGLIISSDLIVPVRMTTPDRGHLIEAHLNFFLAVVSSLTLKIGIGRFDTDGVTPITSYTQNEIDEIHKKIFGSASAVASSGSTLIVDGVDIAKVIPKRGETNFNADGFVLLFQFSRARVTDTITRFDLQCSSLLGLL